VRAVLADHPDEKTISLLAISVSHLEEHWDVQLELPLDLKMRRAAPAPRKAWRVGRPGSRPAARTWSSRSTPLLDGEPIGQPALDLTARLIAGLDAQSRSSAPGAAARDRKRPAYASRWAGGGGVPAAPNRRPIDSWRPSFSGYPR
jgi:hypothetical protein